MKDATCHISVLLNEVLEALRAPRGGHFLDCTLGGGGHTRAILEANGENSVYALDRDMRAVERARVSLSSYGTRLTILHGEFSSLRSLHTKGIIGERSFDGLLADLGVSTDQIKEGRGFSFSDRESLDMRMNEASGSSAADIVNTASEQELFVLLKEGGVGNEARAIARAIIRGRPFSHSAQLASAINSVPHKKSTINPSTIAFQAIRMAVNRELQEIESLLGVAPELVRSGGRVAMITFHSLEDKAVTRAMRSWEGEKAPALWPGAKPENSFGKMITKKAVVPTDDEIAVNPSARSSRLRVFEFE